MTQEKPWGVWDSANGTFKTNVLTQEPLAFESERVATRWIQLSTATHSNNHFLRPEKFEGN